ncbi:MAG: tRNA dihydrouridine synthase [Campylobacteraceae bacterium]
MSKNILDFSQGLVALAPLAGFTDLPFRKIVKKFGADITYSEMISANALAYNSSKTFHMIKKAENETPYIVQIAGSDIKNIIEAVNKLNDIEGIDGIDINCGCPVPKVVSQNAGSSLLKDLPLLQNIIESVKKYSNKTYTSAKVRLGYTEKIPELVAIAVENAGADFIAVHGRTRSGGYTAEVDYEAIKKAKEAVKIPMFANGDITSFEKAINVKNLTKCEGLMIGRGAIGNPWIFYQLKNNLENVEKSKIKEIVFEHFNEMIEFYSPKQGIAIFRKHLHSYSKGIENASNFRHAINRVEDEKEVRDLIEEFFR